MFHEQHIGSDMNWKIFVCVESHLQQSCVGGCHEMKLLRTSYNNGTTYTYLERVQVRLRTLFNISIQTNSMDVSIPKSQSRPRVTPIITLLTSVHSTAPALLDKQNYFNFFSPRPAILHFIALD